MIFLITLLTEIQRSIFVPSTAKSHSKLLILYGRFNATILDTKAIETFMRFHFLDETCQLQRTSDEPLLLTAIWVN